MGLCIGDREYGDRFTSCLMNHYRDQLELHMFSQKEALQENWKTLDAIVLSDDLAGENRIECEIPQIYLFDGNENVDKDVEKGVVFVDKYQEVNKIVDEILKQIGEEIKNASGGVKQKLQVLAVYSLAENEMQLPFAVTLSSILSENEKVLLLDLQENSGLSQLMGEFYSSGMEELLVMAESGKYSKSRMVSCIGHLDRRAPASDWPLREQAVSLPRRGRPRTYRWNTPLPLGNGNNVSFANLGTPVPLENRISPTNEIRGSQSLALTPNFPRRVLLH